MDKKTLLSWIISDLDDAIIDCELLNECINKKSQDCNCDYMEQNELQKALLEIQKLRNRLSSLHLIR